MPWPGSEIEGALVEGQDLKDEGQPQAQSAGSGRLERPKGLRDLHDAGTIVLDDHKGMGRVRAELHGHPPTLGSGLAGVAHHILDRPLEKVFVPADQGRGPLDVYPRLLVHAFPRRHPTDQP